MAEPTALFRSTFKNIIGAGVGDLTIGRFHHVNKAWLRRSSPLPELAFPETDRNFRVGLTKHSMNEVDISFLGSDHALKSSVK